MNEETLFNGLYHIPNIEIEAKIISIFKDNGSNTIEVKYIIKEKDIEEFESNMGKVNFQFKTIE